MEVLDFQRLKTDLHSTLLSRIDLERLSAVDDGRARRAVGTIIQEIVGAQKVPLNGAEKERVESELLDEVFGLGPLEPLLKDPTISDILVNNRNVVYVERHGILERTGAKFRDDRHLMQVIDRIVSRVGRRVDESSPMVDARLPDGSRVNAIIPPLALDGPCMSIRRFGGGPVAAETLVKLKSISAEMMQILAAAVKAKISVLISGGTGAGKTTFLNILSSFIPETERIVTIEDAAELQLKHEDVVRLETRPANVEGLGAVRQRQLLINSLRMRPDRIIIGEVRGDEAFDMLQAMNTGHEGSMTTIHANTSRDALSRLESMVAMASVNMPERSRAPADCVRDFSDRAGVAHERWDPQSGQYLRDHRPGGKHRQHARYFQLCEERHRAGWKGGGFVSAHRDSSQVPRPVACGRHPAADGDL
jgi:pilus assembly protein CpaF